MLYRCTSRNKCGKRRALPRPIEQYVRTPVCKACGGALKADKAQTRRNRANTCKCDGLPYPHRRASTVWCCEHPIGPLDYDYRERYGR